MNNFMSIICPKHTSLAAAAGQNSCSNSIEMSLTYMALLQAEQGQASRELAAEAVWHPKPLSCLCSQLTQPQKQQIGCATELFMTACQLLTFFTKRLPTATRAAGWTFSLGASVAASPAPSAAEEGAASAWATWLAAGPATTAGSATAAGSVVADFTGFTELAG